MMIENLSLSCFDLGCDIKLVLYWWYGRDNLICWFGIRLVILVGVFGLEGGNGYIGWV